MIEQHVICDGCSDIIIPVDVLNDDMITITVKVRCCDKIMHFHVECKNRIQGVINQLAIWDR